MGLVFAIMLKVDLSREDVTSEQIGFILLLNNTIIPAVTLVLGFIAGHVDGNADDQDDWYRGFYNAETAVITWNDPEREDEQRELPNKEDGGIEFGFENPMALSTDL